MRGVKFLVVVILMTSCLFSKGNDSTFYQTNNQHKLVKIKAVDVTKRPKNIIFMIGDGMGIAQIQAGETANKGQLNILQCPVSGYVNTSSNDDFITDSAAGGTAYATGKRTNNHMIALAPDSSKLVSIIDKVSDKDMMTGTVVTCGVTHATPASFLAHRPSREQYQDIALDIFNNENIDVLIGGGYNHFAKRTDGRNLVQEYETKGISVATDITMVKKAKATPFVGLLAAGHMPKVSEGRNGQLPEMVKKAIDLLDNDKGFFLLVEGSQIDWGGHANDLGYIVEEMLDFDVTIGEVLKYAAKDGETLVVITADHETGGLTLTGGDVKEGAVKGDFSTGGHTGVMVPVFAFGPGADLFSGTMKNTDVHEKLLEALGR